jgi:hypothetical protein
LAFFIFGTKRNIESSIPVNNIEGIPQKTLLTHLCCINLKGLGKIQKKYIIRNGKKLIPKVHTTAMIAENILCIAICGVMFCGISRYAIDNTDATPVT